MHDEGDRAHNNIIYCKKLYVQLGGVYRTTCEGIKDGTHTIYTATCADEGETQGALFTVYYSKLQWQPSFAG